VVTLVFYSNRHCGLKYWRTFLNTKKANSSWTLIILCFAEFDALSGCKLSSIDIGATVVRMAYSPAGGHVIVAILEVR
jgi:hypothetical protein